MAYSAWSVTAGETPTATKWNLLGSNDADFNTRLSGLVLVRNILSLSTVDVVVGDGKDWFTIPADFPSGKLEIESIELETDVPPGTSKTVTIDIEKNGTPILASPISITGASDRLNDDNDPDTGQEAVSGGDVFELNLDVFTAGTASALVRGNILMTQLIQGS